MIFDTDLYRYHSAAKLIEVDAEGGYASCCKLYGTDIANMALIMYYRAKHGSLDSYPPEGGFDRLIKDVNDNLKENNLIFEHPIPSFVKRVNLYKIVKQPENQYVKLVGDIGYTEEIEGEFCFFRTIYHDGRPGGYGSVPLNCLVEEKSDFWQQAYINTSKHIDTNPLKIDENLLCKDKD